MDTSGTDPITGEADEAPPKVAKGVQGFQPGHRREHGRARGTPNRVSRLVREAIVEAAALVGEDGEGAEGLVGYLKLLAVTEPRAYASLLGRVLPYQITVDDGPQPLATVEELAEELRRRGLPVPEPYREPGG